MLSKKWIIILSLVIITSFIGSGCSSTPSANKQTSQMVKKQKIELTKEFKLNKKLTIEYIKLLEKRKTFPDSLTIAYDYFYSMNALDSEIRDTYKDKVKLFIKTLQRNDGGFGWDMHSTSSDLYNTYCSIWILKHTNDLNEIDTSKAINYIVSCANDDGGFGFTPEAGSDPIQTYYGVAALYTLGQLNAIDKTSTIGYFESLKTEKGGFSSRKGILPDVRSTYAGLQVLKIYNSLESVDKKKTVSFLLKDQGKDGGFSYVVGDTTGSTPELTYYGLTSLSIFDAIDGVKTAPLSTFFKDRYVANAGGFGDVFYGNPKYHPTSYALACLDVLNQLGDKNSSD